MIPSIASLSPSSPAVPKTDDPVKIRDAAEQFESLLLAQILRSAHDAWSGWLGSGGDSSADSVAGLADEQLAVLMAQQGGLGLRDLLCRGLSRRDSASLPTTSAGAQT